MMNAKHRRALEAIFARPVPSDIRWAESKASWRRSARIVRKGAAPVSGSCSIGAEAVFHRPHPRPETNKGAVASVREFLKMAGIEP